jgi:hypothetical protein
VADVYIDVSRQVLVVVLNEDAGGRRFSVPLYLVFNSYYKKDEVDSLVSRKVEGVRFDFSQELPLVVPVTKNGSSISSSIDFGAIVNAIREDGRLVVACVNNVIFYQLLVADRAEIAFSRVVALDGYQELLIVDESNVWSMEDVDLGTGGGGGGYEPPVGGIPKTDLASDVQASLDLADSALQSQTQANWTQTNTSADDYIKNKPTLATVATSGSYNDLSNKPTIGDNDIVGISDGTASDGAVVFSKRNGDTVTLDFNHSHPQYALANSLSTVATSGDYDDLTGKPTKVSDFTNDSGFTSNAGTITGITMNGASKGTSGVVNLGTVVTAHQDISGKANKSEMAVSTSGDQTTITLMTGTSATVINQHQSLSGYAKYVLLADEAAYTALATKDSGTLYLIPES